MKKTMNCFENEFRQSYNHFFISKEAKSTFYFEIDLSKYASECLLLHFIKFISESLECFSKRNCRVIS